jgi:hypothetical protein
MRNSLAALIVVLSLAAGFSCHASGVHQRFELGNGYVLDITAAPAVYQTSYNAKLLHFLNGKPQIERLAMELYNEDTQQIFIQDPDYNGPNILSFGAIGYSFNPQTGILTFEGKPSANAPFDQFIYKLENHTFVLQQQTRTDMDNCNEAGECQKILIYKRAVWQGAQ